MRNEDMSGLNSNADLQDSEETIANNQDAGRAPVVVRPGAIRVEADANGMVALPPEVALGDIAVVGTDLVIELPDGTQWVIVDGAIFVPQLMIGDVEVPPTNLAALLIGEEPEPAAGQTQSSGGNFSVVVPDLGPPQPLGDLLPPTELDYTPPEPDLAGQFLEPNPIPEIEVISENNPTGAINATADVNESGLPEGPGLDGARGADESEGSDASSNSEVTEGTFVYFSPDTPNVLAVDGLVVNGVVITGPGQIIEGQYGFLEITATRDGEIDFEYTLTDNTGGDNTSDDFSVTVTDVDGDSATATLSIAIIDDVPMARDDADYIAPGGMEADGNVMTGAGTTTGNVGADTEGADGAVVVDASGEGDTDAGEGMWTVEGLYGTLTIYADGDYEYARDPLSPGGVEDVFTYTLEDGDGDQSTATLTIVIDDLGDAIDIVPDPDGGDSVDESGLPAGPGVDNDRDPDEPEGTAEPTDVETATGVISWVDGDGVNVIRINDTIVTGNGQEIEVEGGILTIIKYDPDANIIEYKYTLTDNTSGEDTSISFTVSVTDADNDVATDTITIRIVDDEPVANDDTDTVGAGTYGPETGNVMTGEGTNEGAGGAGADEEGADGAEVTNAVGSGSTTTNEDGDFVVNGTYGVLTIDSEGNYSYVRNEGTPGGVEDVFTYTLTDGDEDSVTATLTIEIEDSGVVVGANATVLVDDDALAGGNAGGIGDDPDGANLVGTLSGAGADEPIGFEFSTTGSPAGFTYVADGDDILIQQNGVTVITVTLDAATGGYTVTQNAAIDHAAGGNENNVVFNIGYTVKDVDGDDANGTLTINADDDTPVVTTDLSGADTLLVDETELGVSDSADFSDAFGVSGGADGLASLVYILGVGSSEGVDSGLVTSDNNMPIYLFSINGRIEAHEGNTPFGDLVFTIEVDDDGTVTLTQYDAIEHPDSPDNYNEIVSLANDLVTLTAVATDGDGDTVSETIEIGSSFSFADDGPSATLDEQFSAPALAVDETDLSTNDTGNSYAGAFDIDFGADGPGVVVYSLTITEGADSGLVDTATGQSILLYTDADGNVEGRVGGEGGAVAFEVSVDNLGNVSLDQVRALVHPDSPDNYDESISPTAGSIQLTATVIDDDADTASATLDISGDISFDDDGPSAGLNEQFSAPTLAVDETDLGVDDDGNSYAGAFDLDGGADGTKSVEYSFTITEGADSGLDTTDGTSIFLFTDADGNVEGRVGGEGGAVAFEVSVDEFGNVSLDQMLSLFHPDSPDNYDEPVSPTAGTIQLTATITDGDDDTASATLDISGDISFDDDGPSIGRAEVSVPTLLVDETDLSVNDNGNAMANLFDIDFGADGEGSVVYSLSLSSQGVDSGLDTTDGTDIFLYNNGDGTVEGRVGGEFGVVAFAVWVDGDGNVNLDQILSLYHPDDMDPDDQVDIADGVLSLTATVTDGDNDTADLSIDIGGSLNFDDDGPSAGLDDEFDAPDLAVDETDLGVDDDGNSYAGAFDLDGGADGTKSVEYSFTITEGADSGLDTTDGTSIFLFTDADGNVEGRVGGEGGAVAFEVSVDEFGNVSLDQMLSLFHPDSPDNYDEPVSPTAGTIQLTATITDGDDDTASATLDISGDISFDDDGPSATDEAAVDVSELATASGMFDFDGGADGATVTHVNDVELVFGMDGWSQSVSLSSGSIRVKADGSYEFTPSNPTIGEPVVTGTFTVTDGDNDTAEADFQFNVIDANKPTGGESFAFVDDDGLSGGNPNDPASDDDELGSDTNPDESVHSGTLAGDFGLDGPGGFSFFDMAGESDTIGQETVEYNWSFNILTGVETLVAVITASPDGDRVGEDLFTITLDTQTGDYSVALDRNVLHSPDGDDIETDNFTIIDYTVSDIDSAPANGTLRIDFDDDVPTVTNEAPADVAENGTATGTFDFVEGADGAIVTAINGQALTFVDNGPNGYSDAVMLSNGSIRVTKDGDYIFTPDDPTVGEVEVNGTFTVTDGDGDEATGDFQFNVTDAYTPTGGASTAFLDDDGLGAGNPNDPASDDDPDADPDGDESTYSGQLAGDIGDDGPGGFSFSGISGDFATIGQETVQFSYVGGVLTAEITASIDASRVGLDLFTLTLNETTGTYDLVLERNVLHDPNGDDIETNNSVVLDYTVSDTDSPAADGTLTVTFDDDVPTVTNEAPADVAENGTATGTFDFVEGADGAIVTAINGQALTFVDNGPNGYSDAVMLSNGSIRVTKDGDYIFTPDDPTVGEVEVNGTFTVTDGDGDEATGDFQFNVTDAYTPTGGASTAFLDDDGLGAGNPNDPASDDDPDADPDGDESTYSGQLAGDIGDDGPGGFSFSGISGDFATIGQETVQFSYVGGVLTAEITASIDASRVGLDLFTLTLNETTGTYDLVLERNVLHDPNGDDIETNNSVVLDYTVSDTDSPAADGTLTVTFDDDVPTVTNDEPAANVNEGATESGQFDFVGGADGGVVTHINNVALQFADDQLTTLSSAVDLGNGASIRVARDGSYEFTAADPTNGTPTINGTFTVTDADGDSDSGSFQFNVQDIYNPTAGDIDILLDDDGLPLGNPTDPASDDDPAADPDGDESTYSGVVPHDFGGDGAGFITMQQMNGGTDTVGQEDVTYSWSYDSNTGIETLIAVIDVAGTPEAAREGETLFTVTLNRATGDYTVTMNLNVLHSPDGDDIETNTLDVGAITIDYAVFDADNATGVPGTIDIDFDDDVPTINSAPTINAFVEVNGGTWLQADGTLIFDIGADRYFDVNTEIDSYLSFSLTGTIGGETVTFSTPTYVDTQGAIALYGFDFDHDGATIAGTIQVDLGNGDFRVIIEDTFESTITVPFSQAIRETKAVDGQGKPTVIVSELTESPDPLFVQFSGLSGSLQAGGDGAFAAGEVFSGSTGWLSVSGTSNGVDSDTLQNGEVLDFDLFSSDPGADLNAAPTSYAEGLTITVDQFNFNGGGEDLVVILKLADPNNPGTILTTRAIIVKATDVYGPGDTIPTDFGTPDFTGLSNPGFIIIEQQDYQLSTDLVDYVVVGAQLMTSTNNLTGSGYVLNGAVGDGGDTSETTQTFAATGSNDQDVVKIVDVGLIRSVTTPDAVSMNVAVTLEDSDGDQDTATIQINPPAQQNAFTSKIALDAANDDAVMAQLNQSQSLMMSSAMALGFAAALPAKFAWGHANVAEVVAMDTMAYDVASLASSFGTMDAGASGVTAFAGATIGGSDALAGQSSFVAAKEGVDVSLDVTDMPVEAPSAPKADTASVAMTDKVAIVDMGDVIIPGADALAAMIANDAGSVDLAVVAKEALVEVDGGDVDALLAQFGGDDAGAPEAVATLMVVGQEAIGTDAGGYLSANIDALLTDVALMHQDAATAVVNG